MLFCLINNERTDGQMYGKLCYGGVCMLKIVELRAGPISSRRGGQDGSGLEGGMGEDGRRGEEDG